MKNIYKFLSLRLLAALRLSQNEKGVTFVEAMAAAGIFSIAITGLSVSLVQLGSSRQKVNIVNSAVALQAYLIDDISNPESYPDDATRASVVAGSSANLNFLLNYTDFKGTAQSVTFSSPNWENFFTMDLAPCPAASFADENCAIRANLGFLANSFAGQDINAGGAATTRYSWKAAYHITINPATKVNVGNFGAPTIPFAAIDYKHTLPDLSNKSVDALTSCNMATHVAIRGVDRDTGQVYCILRPDPTEVCVGGKLPRKFVLVGNKLTLDCADGNVADDIIPRSFSCPTDYSLQIAQNTSSLFFKWQPIGDPLNTYTLPQCVFRGESNQSVGLPVPPPSPGRSGAAIFGGGNIATAVGPTLTVTRGVCPRPPAPTGISYSHDNTATCAAGDFNDFNGGQCCDIAGCVGSMIFFGYGGVNPVASDNATSTDQKSCSVSTSVYWHPDCDPDQTGCTGARPAYREARLVFGAATNCRLTQPLNTSATASPP